MIAAARIGNGGAVLLTGDAGIGKSTLLAEAREAAHGFRVLRCHGVQNGCTGFAALHQLLHPVMSGVENLPARQSEALKVAFGLSEAGPSERLIASIATLGLLEEAAEHQPLLVTVDDLHWVDQPTAEIVGFVAGRLASAPILLIATTRVGSTYKDWQDFFPEVMPLSPLSTDESRVVLDRAAPHLESRARDLIIDQSYGNPLALNELSTNANLPALTLRGAPARYSMTKRLEQAFLAEAAQLPASSRLAMLVVAAGEDLSYPEIFAAGQALGLSAEDFAAPERAGLVAETADGYRFRHPLVSSAIHEDSDSVTHRQVHEALASVARNPERAWRHRAAATISPDEEVAQELDGAGKAAEARGAVREATDAWLRASELSPTVSGQARRLVRAAEAARQAGASALAGELILRARPLVKDESLVVALARTEWLLTSTSSFAGITAAELLGIAGTLSNREDRTEVLVWVAAMCYLGQEPSAVVRSQVIDELVRLDVEVGGRDEVLRQIGLALADPERPISDVGKALEAFTGHMRPTDGTLLNCLAFAAESMADLPGADKVWSAEIELFHRAGRVSDETIGLSGRGVLRVTANALTDGLADSEQALRLSDDLGMKVVSMLASANIARVRAWRGEADAATSALNFDRDASPAPRVIAIGEWAQGILAVNEGRYEDAIAHLLNTSLDAQIALWAYADLAEPAAKTQNTEILAQWFEEASRVVAKTESDHLRMLIDRSRALVSEGDLTRELFESAISSGERCGARFDLARTHLHYGEWLRRERHVVEARTHLSAALRVFDAESTLPLADRASQELRAAGGVDARRRAEDEGTRQLSGQELIVVRLAADGLSNKEIADRIYLSHRTVGAHLHRAFAKLGVNRRSQLAAILVDTGAGHPTVAD
ncbi:AAA family ATPase [Protaetiibacter intestinalis]|nr:helix-turn-helix transcriptional regulator [Protaetiibacter intestinalis]